MTMHLAPPTIVQAGHVIQPAKPAGGVCVGDIVSFQTIDGQGWRGQVTEMFRFGRVKVECVDASGEVERFSVDVDALTMIRRADA